ncbi:hypothetical protein EGR_10194 [Echinococcus granulosus]|uniref:Uncharacterized protein n=1 Tax=Echinococcus granulosus TaxID=6210 RepID=W6UNN8_ECHGR|nr:hypothetical protein EGR_10194 [Echinococcus granulosus]EUB54959.1 hypothetical protein EGR_10194 [Echinococcus granulosus]
MALDSSLLRVVSSPQYGGPITCIRSGDLVSKRLQKPIVLLQLIYSNEKPKGAANLILV